MISSCCFCQAFFLANQGSKICQLNMITKNYEKIWFLNHIARRRSYESSSWITFVPAGFIPVGSSDLAIDRPWCLATKTTTHSTKNLKNRCYFLNKKKTSKSWGIIKIIQHKRLSWKSLPKKWAKDCDDASSNFYYIFKFNSKQ